MKKSLTVTRSIPEPGRTILAIVQAATRGSRAEAKRLIHAGHVTVNGRVQTQSHATLAVGDRVDVDHLPPPARVTPGTRSRRVPVEVIFDDAYLIVVNKPAQVLTVPTPHREKNTLLTLVTSLIQRDDPAGQAYCVHRLDRGVSGLLVMAKSLPIAEQLREQFAARKPQRQYTAIVSGKLPQAKGTVRTYLATDAELNRYSLRPEDIGEAKGELAITHYSRNSELPGATVVTVTLETGRRNQIRVHLAELGNPVLGDPRYGTAQSGHRLWPYRRLALHAETLGFQHPVTGQSLCFRGSWPEEFREFKRRASRRSS